ncbi:unnamed protein product, partial [Larinioides sclopetarius]
MNLNVLYRRNFCKLHIILVYYVVGIFEEDLVILEPRSDDEKDTQDRADISSSNLL